MSEGAKWPRKQQRLSAPQKRLVRAVVQHVAVDPSLVYKTLKLTHIQSALTDALRRKGLTPERMADLLADAVVATRSLVGGSRRAPVVLEVPDHQVRLGAYDRVVAAHGLVPRTADLPEAQPPPVSIVFQKLESRDDGGGQSPVMAENVTIVIGRRPQEGSP